MDICNRMEQFYNSIRNWLWLLQRSTNNPLLDRENLTPFQKRSRQITFDRKMAALRDARNNLKGIGETNLLHGANSFTRHYLTFET